MRTNTNTNKNILMNFLINPRTKTDFGKVCAINNTNMSSEINRFIRDFIKEQNEYFQENIITSNEVKDLYDRKVRKNYNFRKWEKSYMD